MGGEDSLKKVSAIIQSKVEKGEHPVVVCSAMSGVTDKLLEMGKQAENKEKEKAKELFETIKERHLTLALQFDIYEAVQAQFKDLENLIEGVVLIGELSQRSLAYLTSFGERFSTRLLTGILKKEGVLAQQFDSDFIKTQGVSYWEDEVDWESTRSLVQKALEPFIQKGGVPVVTGFFGTNAQGEPSLFGRGGSDFSGAILAVSLECKKLEIWTDVDGFLSADPRIVPQAKVIDEIGFTEASELCFFGAKVLHPKTIRPVIEKGGEVWIKNTFNAQAAGTKITKHGKPSTHPVLSIAGKSVGTLSLDLFGVPMGKQKSEIFLEFFTVAQKYQVNVDMIASSEAVLSVCVEESELENQKFLDELSLIAPLEVRRGRKILSIVSPENIQGSSGVLGKIFGALGSEEISVEMDSENTSEIAQLVVVKSENAEKAIRAIHKSLVQ